MDVIEMKPNDHVNLNLEDNVTFNGKIGVFIKKLSKKEIEELTQQNRWDDLCGPLVIEVLNVNGIHFNSWRRDNVPQEEKKWLFMNEEELVLRKEGTEAGPLTLEEIVELELSQFTTPPYTEISYIPTRIDKKCWIEGCDHDEYDAIWFNMWGYGRRVPVCKKHFEKHGKITMCDTFPIKLKKENN